MREQTQFRGTTRYPNQPARILEITKIYRRAVALPRAATHVSRAQEVTIRSLRIKLGQARTRSHRYNGEISRNLSLLINV